MKLNHSPAEPNTLGLRSFQDDAMWSLGGYASRLHGEDVERHLNNLLKEACENANDRKAIFRYHGFKLLLEVCRGDEEDNMD